MRKDTADMLLLMQVFDAGDNALLCEKKHQGRVNAALGFSFLGKSCVASISEDKKLSIFSKTGEEVTVIGDVFR